MRELLFVGIFVALSLALQIFFLRLSTEVLHVAKDDPRFKKMVRLIYLNLGFYILLIFLLFRALLKT